MRRFLSAKARLRPFFLSLRRCANVTRGVRGSCSRSLALRSGLLLCPAPSRSFGASRQRLGAVPSALPVAGGGPREDRRGFLSSPILSRRADRVAPHSATNVALRC